MPNYDELKKAAEEAAVIDHNENPRWYEYSDLIRDVIFYPKNAKFIALSNPATILSLLAEREKLLKVVDAAKTVSQSLNAPSLRGALKELEK